MIRIEINNDECEIFGPFPMEFVKLLSRVSGRKRWIGGKKVFIEASHSNIKIIKNSGFEIEWNDKTGTMKEIYELELMATQHSNAPKLDTVYVPAVPYLKHMEHCLGLSWDRKAYALLLEMGLCKTSITIHNFGMLYKKNKLTGVIIVAPKGVHVQWIVDQIPEHLDKSVRMNVILWDKKAQYDRRILCVEGRLNIFAMNTDAIRTDAGAKAASLFVRLHQGHVMLVCDESHAFANYGSERTKAAINIAHACDYRRILTGTPISNSLENMWAQFMLLDPKIIGINYLSVFRASYCEMGGFEGRTVVGHKNVEQFYSIIAPHSYRLTKAEATDLPPKMMMKRYYEMDKKTKDLYEDMANTYMMEIDNGILDAANALACAIRLQQLLSGYVTIDKETKELQMISTQRAEICVDMLKQIRGQTIVFCAFIPDRTILSDIIKSELKEDIAYLGDYQNYQNRSKRILLINQASCAGLNLQFSTKGDNNSIFYNNTRRSIHRWQAEDRNWRTGVVGETNIWDIICNNSVDNSIFKRLKENKDFSDLVLDDIRKIIAGTYETEYERAE